MDQVPQLSLNRKGGKRELRKRGNQAGECMCVKAHPVIIIVAHAACEQTFINTSLSLFLVIMLRLGCALVYLLNSTILCTPYSINRGML